MFNKNLTLVTILIIIWSIFFAIYKYFVWWIYANDTITLQFISWYLSIWTIFSFIIWGLFYELIKEKKYHFISWLFTLSIIIVSIPISCSLSSIFTIIF